MPPTYERDGLQANGKNTFKEKDNFGHHIPRPLTPCANMYLQQNEWILLRLPRKRIFFGLLVEFLLLVAMPLAT